MTKVDRKKKINIMLNDEKRIIITEKAIEYGFDLHLAAYVRSACIYETVYKENIEVRIEILTKISKIISAVNRIKYEQGQLVKNLVISKGDIKMIEDNNNIFIMKLRI